MDTGVGAIWEPPAKWAPPEPKLLVKRSSPCPHFASDLHPFSDMGTPCNSGVYSYVVLILLTLVQCRVGAVYVFMDAILVMAKLCWHDGNQSWDIGRRETFCWHRKPPVTCISSWYRADVIAYNWVAPGDEARFYVSAINFCSMLCSLPLGWPARLPTAIVWAEVGLRPTKYEWAKVNGRDFMDSVAVLQIYTDSSIIWSTHGSSDLAIKLPRLLSRWVQDSGLAAVVRDPHTASVMGTWGSLISLREMVTPIHIPLVILGWGSS